MAKNQLIDNRLGDGSGGDVSHGYQLDPAGESVDHHHYVGVTSGRAWQRSQQVKQGTFGAQLVVPPDQLEIARNLWLRVSQGLVPGLS